ncbi:Clan SC, family S28, unassigned serine peptidase [Tritrichomonas foetus]|uniref:Clan SC, family S28, unassigned serine peptidase n=1 Tax=Tritrichomonas foetus TaxID=1144522 RepID=A0A1J4JSM3_9EUKA|nr:Clan SC, family S28, unassigned serine peptidase [Tritrichomonas foetus]|eukprot:OHT00253.1 Clan SC, family S28, unassigned serine peptidase [Tritrichomonas foetus]
MFLFALCLRMFRLDFRNDVETFWYQNKIDHFNVSDKRTYQQRYHQNLDYVPAEGFTNVVLYFGGESPLGPSAVESGSYIELAKRLNASIFGLEHRFFGLSQPFDDLSNEHLKYLTIDQAMADLAQFIEEKIHKHERANKNSEIRIGVVGGSYPGALSSWFRLKYPNLAYASWASSAPVYVKNDFPEYDNYVATQLEQYSPKCLANTKIAFDEAEKLANTNIEKFRSDFGFLETEQLTDMLYAMTDVVCAMVQYNSNFDNIIEKHCQMQETASYENLVKIIIEVNKMLGQTMPDNDLRLQKNTSLQSSYANGRAWSYMTCNEVGWFQTASGRLRSNTIDLNYFAGLCQDLFDIDQLADNDEKNRYFGSNNPQQSRVVFLNGDVDPWSTLSVHESDVSLSRHAVIIANESHCSDLYEISEKDSEVLADAKDFVILQMQDWLTREASQCNLTLVHGRCGFDGCVCEDKWGGKCCDVQMTTKDNLDIAIICSISIPVVLFVCAIFASWLWSSHKKKKELNPIPLITSH